VGDGILAGQLHAAIRDTHLEPYFQFTGLVPPERIPALVGAIDVLVHVSLREGLARALPQALIAGKPVISYDVDGAREVVIDGETGILLPPASVDELAAAIGRLAADGALRARLGTRGRGRFADQFRHQRTSEQLLTLYRRLLVAKAGTSFASQRLLVES
jgi:glycosyltransferase involved in cell wall biosynthesis